MEARDRWIGWDWESRRANLHHVVNMSRFLIRPGVSCNNLASRVLGMSIREFPGDFETRYGHRPLLLESFVDTRHYTVSVMDREADPENEFRTSFFEIFDDQRRNSSRVDLLGERRESSCRYTTGRVVFADDN